MNFLITGGAGFIGTNLAKVLFDRGHRVRILDNAKMMSFGFHLDDYKFTDVVSKEARIQCQGIDTIIHLAAETGVQPSVEDPEPSVQTNVLGTLNMLEGAIEYGVKRFILASSGTVLGNASPPFEEKMMTRPTSPYGASKLAGEAYCSAYYHSYGLETVVLRFSNIYGPHAWHKNNLFVNFIRAALKEEPLHIYGDGRQTRDFLYVKDLVEAIILASTVPDIGGQVFQVASGKETSILTLLEIMKAISLEEIAQEVEYTFEPPRPGEAKRSYAYNYYAKLMLGWEPKYDLVTGMTETFRWYLRKYYYE